MTVPPTAPFIIQWAEGGPRGSQGVTLMISLVGTPGNDALLAIFDLVNIFNVVAGGYSAHAKSGGTDDQVFTLSVADTPVLTVTIPGGTPGVRTAGVFDVLETAWPVGTLEISGPALISDPIADISMTITGAQ